MSGNVLYSVSLNQRRWTRLEAITRTRPAKPDTVYCVTVPSSYFLIRWNDTISVTGNTNYGLTPEGMALMFPDVYDSVAHAKRIQEIYFTVFPMIPAFQLDVKKRAAKFNRLGGPVAAGKTILTDTNAHVFTYEHEFYNVVEYRKLSPAQARNLKQGRSTISTPVIDINGVPHAMKWGPDSKRSLAFYPQSTARGILAECEIELFVEPAYSTYIGSTYYGRTPLRGPIHDSLFLEVPFRKIDRVVESVAQVMLAEIEEMPLRPEWNMGQFLTIGVEAKIGDDWEDMQELVLPSPSTGVAADGTYFPAEESEEEDANELRTAMA